MCVTWRIHVCDMTHSCVWHDAFIRVTWRIHTCDRSYAWDDSFIRVTWLIHTCGITHSYVWHFQCTRFTWLIHARDMAHLYEWQDSFIRVPWLIHTCATTHSYVWHDRFIRVTRLFYTCNTTHRIARQGVLENVEQAEVSEENDPVPQKSAETSCKIHQKGFQRGQLTTSRVHDGLIIEKPSAGTIISLLSHVSGVHQSFFFCRTRMSHFTCQWANECVMDWSSKTPAPGPVSASCHTRVSHATAVIWIIREWYESAVSRMNDSYHMQMSPGTCEWVPDHMNKSCHKKIKSLVCVSDVNGSVQECVIKGRDNCISTIFLISLSFASLNLNYVTFPFSSKMCLI